MGILKQSKQIRVAKYLRIAPLPALPAMGEGKPISLFFVEHNISKLQILEMDMKTNG